MFKQIQYVMLFVVLSHSHSARLSVCGTKYIFNSPVPYDFFAIFFHSTDQRECNHYVTDFRGQTRTGLDHFFYSQLKTDKRVIRFIITKTFIILLKMFGFRCYGHNSVKINPYLLTTIYMRWVKFYINCWKFHPHCHSLLLCHHCLTIDVLCWT